MLSFAGQLALLIVLCVLGVVLLVALVVLLLSFFRGDNSSSYRDLGTATMRRTPWAFVGVPLCVCCLRWLI
jgi:amino acid permease